MAAKKKQIVEVAPATPAPSEEVYRTSDLYLAAYIIASQRRLKGTECTGKRVTFVFDREAGTLRSSWLDPSSVVNAQAFTTAIKNLKNLVSHDD